MSTAPTEDLRTHPLHWFSGRLHEVLDQVGEPATSTLTDAELAEVTTELTGGIARLQGQLMAVLSEAERDHTANLNGAVNTAGWLRGLTRATGPESSRLARTALDLDDYEATRSALTAGRINLDQARAIVDAVDAVPAEHREPGEAHLLKEAETFDAKMLRSLGRHLLEVVAPELADEHLAAQLEREEKEAGRKTSFSMYDDGHGTCHGKFKLPSLRGAMLEAALQALANPARPDAIERHSEGQLVPSSQVMGEAFGQLIERYPVGRPAVLDGESHVLDLGRKRRLHTKAQRLALAIEQRGACAADGCDRPSHWADAHHPKPWSEGGETSTRNGVLLCPRHHTLAHDARFQVTRLGTGKLRIHRRT